MRRTIAATLAALTVLFGPVAHGAQSAAGSDREQVVAVMTALDETWNNHDMRGHAALMHDDGVWIAWTGEVLSGADAYEAKLTELHKTIFSKSVHKGRIEEVTFVAPDVAVVRGYGTAVGNGSTPEKVHQYRILIVLTKRDGVWKLGWGQKTRFADNMPDLSDGK